MNIRLVRVDLKETNRLLRQLVSELSLVRKALEMSLYFEHSYRLTPTTVDTTGDPPEALYSDPDRIFLQEEMERLGFRPEPKEEEL